MKKIVLSGTDLNVSRLAIGTAQFGSKISKKDAFQQLDSYISLEGNLIDTAHVYGNWIPGLDSPSEEVIGEWLKKAGQRNNVYISTKGGHPEMGTMSVKRVVQNELEKDLEGSLGKLGIDCVDLYFLHRDDPAIPVIEILGWLEKKVKEGKIRYYGCSNWGLQRMTEAQEIAIKEGFRGFVCNQVMGCLADVNVETLPSSNVVMDSKIRAYHEKTQLSFMAYMSLARGYFVSRLANVEISQESIDNYTTPSNEKILNKLKELCDQELKVLDFCYQYLIQQRFPTIPIAGFSGIKQIEEAVKSIDCNMPYEILEQVTKLKVLQ